MGNIRKTFSEEEKHLIIKRRWIFLLIILTFFGCSKYTGKEALFTHVKTIENFIDNEDWDQLNQQVDQLNTLYEKNKWKLQLLGDEDEYESLTETIDRLIVAIDEQDKTQAKLELATVKSILKELYSL